MLAAFQASARDSLSVSEHSKTVFSTVQLDKSGAIVSSVEIVCVSETVLPHSSVAVQVLVIISVLPQAATVLSVNVIVVIPQVSVAVAVPVAEGSVLSVHSTVVSAGTVKTGAVVSSTEIV